MGTRIIIVFVLVSKFALGQLILEPGFKPNSLPYELYNTSMEKIANAEESFAKESKREHRLSLQKYYINTNFQIDKLFQQGKVSCNNEATKYIEDILLSMGLQGYKVYIYLSPYANAFATDRKEIFINAGLFSLLETEAELAFVLCHEAIHVNRRHSLSSYMNEFDIDVNDEKISKLSVEAKVEFTQHSYSKNVELEADSLGLDIFSFSEYNINAALTSIAKLDRSNVPLKGDLFRLEKLFLGNYIDYKKYDKLVGDSIDKESTTHPSSDLRYRTIQDRIKKLKGGNNDYVISESIFSSLKRQVLKHMPSMFLNGGNLNSAIYSAVQLMDDNNEFEQRKVILKSLYKELLYRNHAKQDSTTHKYPEEIIKVAKLLEDLSDKSLTVIAFREIDEIMKNDKWKNDEELKELAWRFHYENIQHNSMIVKILSSNGKSNYNSDLEEVKDFKEIIDFKTPNKKNYVIEFTKEERFNNYEIDTTSEAYKKGNSVFAKTLMRIISLKSGASQRKLRKLYSYDHFDVISPYYNRFRLSKLDVYRPVESDEGRSKILDKYEGVQKKYPNVDVYDNYLMRSADVDKYCQLVNYWSFADELNEVNPLVAVMPTYYSSFKNLNGALRNRILIQQNIVNASRVRKFNMILAVFLNLYYLPLYVLTAKTGAYVAITNSYDVNTGQLVLLKSEFHYKKGKFSDFNRQLKKSVKILR